MKEKHYIKKVLNNNVVFSKNKDGKEIQSVVEMTKLIKDIINFPLKIHIKFSNQSHFTGIQISVTNFSGSFVIP